MVLDNSLLLPYNQIYSDFPTITNSGLQLKSVLSLKLFNNLVMFTTQDYNLFLGIKGNETELIFIGLFLFVCRIIYQIRFHQLIKIARNHVGFRTPDFEIKSILPIYSFIHRCYHHEEYDDFFTYLQNYLGKRPKVDVLLHQEIYFVSIAELGLFVWIAFCGYIIPYYSLILIPMKITLVVAICWRIITGIQLLLSVNQTINMCKAFEH